MTLSLGEKLKLSLLKIAIWYFQITIKVLSFILKLILVKYGGLEHFLEQICLLMGSFIDLYMLVPILVTHETRSYIVVK